MKKYVCPVCGYVHEGELPEGFVCPVCKVPGSKFKVMEEGKLASTVSKNFKLLSFFKSHKFNLLLFTFLLRYKY